MLTEKEIEIFLKEQNIFYKIEVEEEERAIILETGDNDFSDGEIQIILENNKINFVRVDYGFIRFIETIDNNIIEFKHYLQKHKKDIEITSQDIIDWIKTFKSYKKISIKHNILENFFIIEEEKKLYLFILNTIFKDNVCVFTATNSQEYWKLYNIIKNLKE